MSKANSIKYLTVLLNDTEKHIQELNLASRLSLQIKADDGNVVDLQSKINDANAVKNELIDSIKWCQTKKAF